MIDLKILKIASDTKYYGLKNIYSHQTRVKNKICGDLIKIELQVKKDKINLMRYETESCIFCQASADRSLMEGPHPKNTASLFFFSFVNL